MACVFQSDLKWLLLLCFPCCRSLPCCRHRAHLSAGSRSAHYQRGAGGGGGGRKTDRFIGPQRRFTDPPAVRSARACRFQMDTYTVRRPTPAAVEVTTARVNVYRPPTTPPGSAVDGVRAIGNAQVVVHGDSMEVAAAGMRMC